MLHQHQIAIAIPTYRRSEPLLACLRSCLQQQGVSYEIHIFSSHQHDLATPELCALLAQHSNIHVHLLSHQGVSYARQKATQLIQTPFIYFLDDDCILEKPDQLLQLTEILNKNPDVWAVGGAYKNQLSTDFFQRFYNDVCNTWLDWYRQQDSAHALLGGNTAYRRSIFMNGISFQTHIRYGGSETVVNQKIKQLGGELYYSDELSVIHDAKLGARDLVRKAWLQGRHRPRGQSIRSRNRQILKTKRFWKCLPYFMLSHISYRAHQLRELQMQ